MSRTERLYRSALRAYPREYREARSGEILGTLAEGSSHLQLREVAGLLLGGLRQRGLTAGGATLEGSWIGGARLAALVVLLYTATASLFPLVNDLWYVHLGLHWPLSQQGVHLVAASRDVAIRELIEVVVPLAAAAALCRGRVWIAIAGSALTGVLPVIGLSAYGGTMLFLPAATSWYVADITHTAFLLAPAALLWPSRHARAVERHSLAWLLMPFVLAAFGLAFWTSTITFWTLGILVVSWAALSRVDPRLGFAAFAVSVCASLYLVEMVLLQTAYSYAGTLAIGALLLGSAALASALRPRTA